MTAIDPFPRGDLYGEARSWLRDATRVVPHTDADGLAAGAIALRVRGESAADALLLGRGRNPFSITDLPKGTLAVLDWGVRPLSRNAVFVDHHAPETDPGPGSLVISGHGETPEVSTAPLLRRIFPEAAPWLAAVGAVGDLGPRAWELPECTGAPKTATARLTALVNAPRRLQDGPVAEALTVLIEAEDVRAALHHPLIPLLDEARRAWKEAYKEALRVAPEVRDGIAVVRLSSPYQIHPLVAQAWSRRLHPAVVVVANDSYLPGKVNFSLRGGNGDLRRLLRIALPDERGEFAHGHARATGGSLDPERFDVLVDAMRRVDP